MPACTKKLILSCLTLLFVLLAAGCAPSAALSPAVPPADLANTAYTPVTIHNFDAAENHLDYTYRHSPTRVAITHPGATELLLELGLEDRILATLAPYGPPLKRVAERYAKLTIMAAQFVPSQEEMLEMDPDMIIGWSHNFSESALSNVQFWQERNIATYIMPSSLSKTKPTLEDSVYALVNDMGKIFGVRDKAADLIKSYRDRVAYIEQRTSPIQHKKTVMVLQNQSNGQFSLYDSSYVINLMIKTAGGIPVADDIAFIVGAEKVLAYDPDYILYVSFSKNGTEDLSDEDATAQLKQLDELSSMRAIRENHIINMPFFTVNNGGIRTVDAIEKIARQLYPEHMQVPARPIR